MDLVFQMRIKFVMKIDPDLKVLLNNQDFNMFSLTLNLFIHQDFLFRQTLSFGSLNDLRVLHHKENIHLFSL